MDFGTAGFGAPLAIVLRVGLVEAAAVLAIGLVGLLSAAFMHRELQKAPLGGSMAFIMAVMGLSGIVLTRDLFNLFVFLEISAIATYGLIGFDDRRPALRSAFKYMMAGGIASALYLIGVIYIYRFGDTLNLDIAAAAIAAGGTAGLGSATGLSSAAGTAAIFFLLAALLVELKPFPANGWGIDVYETANPGVAALLSGASATALVVALWKLLPILGNAHLAIVAGSGLATFAAANLAGARQSGTRRMLGYSSAAQIGLVTAVVAMVKLLNLGDSGFHADGGRGSDPEPPPGQDRSLPAVRHAGAGRQQGIRVAPYPGCGRHAGPGPGRPASLPRLLGQVATGAGPGRRRAFLDDCHCTGRKPG
jgi:formate hydrogenlyase subunit 3/multisubunit Na+/H+ antiporter MnhD subunit